MGIFSRTKEGAPEPRQLIEPSLIEQLPGIGQASFRTPPQYVDVSGFYLPGLQAAGFPTEADAWDAFVDQFVAELSQGSDRLGGWANAGAFQVAKDLVKSEDWAKPNLVALMDRGLEFLAGAGVDRSSIPNFALGRFNEFRERR